jgi:multidrug resistance efflux pump
MDPLPPISAPPGLLWREFRVRFLPALFFLGVAATAVTIWRSYLQPVTVVGQVETNTATVISIQDGTLVELTVSLLDRVSKDQVIGRVSVADQALTQASLEAIAADLRLMQARMDLDRVRNRDSYTRQRINLLAEKTALAIAKVQLTQAKAELDRATELFEKKLIPQGVGLGQGGVFGVEVAQRDYDALRTDIEHRTQLVSQLEEEIRVLERAGATNLVERDPVVEAAIVAQQEALSLQNKPINLKAPVDGMVSLIFKQPGEKLVRGTPILTLSPLTSTRIIGHLRQPINRVPTTNDLVVIRSRSSPHRTASAAILKIGTQLEPINPFLISPDGIRQEIGLPILVAIPPELQLRPGEYVDLSIQYSSRK